MKKILCLIDSLGTGGAERQMMGLTQLLKEKGYDVDLATYIPHKYHEVLSEKYGLTSISLTPEPNRLGKFKAVKQLIIKNKYDVVIAYKNGPTVITSVLKMLGFKYKLIVSERNTTQVLTRNEKIKFFTYRAADYIVPNSYSQQRFIESHYKNLISKTQTITNYADTDFFHPVEREENDPVQILTVARVGRQKNVLKYLDVVKKLKDEGVNVNFVWYGNVQIKEDDYHSECMERVKELGIEDTIRFMPGTSKIYEMYHQSDIFCLPSIYEGYPNVVCEAMCSGMPVLCSEICDNSTIIEDGVNGYLFNPNNVDNMAERIKKMVNLTVEQRRAMGVKSREIAVKKFSRELFVEKYIKLIEA